MTIFCPALVVIKVEWSPFSRVMEGLLDMTAAVVVIREQSKLSSPRIDSSAFAWLQASSFKTTSAFRYTVLPGLVIRVLETLCPCDWRSKERWRKGRKHKSKLKPSAKFGAAAATTAQYALARVSTSCVEGRSARTWSLKLTIVSGHRC